MRIALLSDIHGNPIALDAVLADGRSAGVEQFWFVGDFAALGPDPVRVLERVSSLHNAVYVRGNTDRYIVTGEGPPPTLEAVRADPSLIPRYVEIAASTAWTRGYVTAHGWFEWLESLPLEARLDTPEGLRLLAVHASPGKDDGEGMHAGHSDLELRDILAGCNAELLFVGHTHEPLIRWVDDTVVVNLGSVSNPRSSDTRASYVLLEIDSRGVELVHRRVPYDTETFVDAVYESRHPSAEFLLSYHRGEHPLRAPHPDYSPLPLETPVRIPAREISAPVRPSGHGS